MYPATESGQSESGPFVTDDYFLPFFIRRAPVEDNAASECIRTTAATYCCKILQLYQYNADVYGIPPQEYQFMQHKRQLITG